MKMVEHNIHKPLLQLNLFDLFSLQNTDINQCYTTIAWQKIVWKYIQLVREYV